MGSLGSGPIRHWTGALNLGHGEHDRFWKRSLGFIIDQISNFSFNLWNLSAICQPRCNSRSRSLGREHSESINPRPGTGTLHTEHSQSIRATSGSMNRITKGKTRPFGTFQPSSEIEFRRQLSNYRRRHQSHHGKFHPRITSPAASSSTNQTGSKVSGRRLLFLLSVVRSRCLGRTPY